MSKSLEEFMEILPRAKRYGHYVAGLCPWHEDDHPSLFVYEDGWFRCVAEDKCGVQGPHEKLYNKLQNPDSYFPPEDKRYYPPQIPDDLEAFTQMAVGLLDKYPFRKRYLTDRGICGMISIARLGWYEGWYTVPVIGEAGVQGMVLRASEPVADRTGYRYITNQEPMPYIPNRALLEGAEALFVVFGIFDALVIAEMGYPAVTTTGGAGTFNPEWLSEWRLPIRIIPDEGEEVTAYKVARPLGWRGRVERLNYPEGGKDVNDIYQLYGEEVLRTVLKRLI